MNDAALQIADETIYQETSAGFSKVLVRFSQAETSDKTGADIIRPHAFLERSGEKKKYPLWNVLLHNVPLSAIVHYEEGLWFAELDWLNVIGEGSSPSDAIVDLETHIDHFVALYAKQLDDKLTDYALELKHRFEQIDQII